ncbi:MAG: ABC transporter ATP-binding protein [Candidatus Rokubacteria bacterium]|nr:ABC transporter ATP-binding protein [Candidatus Rokubacteria bacterium]
MLRASGLVKTYRAPSGAPVSTVLDRVALTVKSGEMVVVIGPSGSGKSTLLNVLGLRSRARGRSIGFVFQSFLLLPSLTALDNVLLAARYVGRVTEDTRRRALGLLETLGVAHRRDHYPPQLSGGEQQRVAFCRAVLNDPPVLLADEPTGNLDDANGRVILAGLRRRAQDGAAVVVVSHRPDAVADATAVYRLEAGTLRTHERNAP